MDILHSLLLVAHSHKIFHSKSNSTCRKSTHLLLKQSATIYKFLTKQQSGYNVDLLEILLILLSPAEHNSFFHFNSNIEVQSNLIAQIQFCSEPLNLLSSSNIRSQSVTGKVHTWKEFTLPFLSLTYP